MPAKKRKKTASKTITVSVSVPPVEAEFEGGAASEAAAFVAEDLAESPVKLPEPELWEPSPRGRTARRTVFGLIMAAVVLLPLSVNQISNLRAISLALIYVVVGLSINILMGYLGQISLGHQAFFGVGAFTSALVVTNGHQSFFLGLIVAGLFGALSAVLLGVVALRLKGLYLALITLAYGSVAEFVIFNTPAITGGGAGVDAPRPTGFTSEKAYVYLCMAVVALILYVDWRLVRSKVGRAIFAIRENEIAAASFGINVTAYKLIAFVISGIIAGLAGGLFAHRVGTVVATDFDFGLALTFVLMTVVGGLGSRVGVFIGSAFFALLPLLLSTLYDSRIGSFLHLRSLPFIRQLQDHTQFIGALLLLLTITLYPGGIAQQIRPITNWLGGKRFREKHRTISISEGGSGVRP